ncbi:siphovirus Gp157 family protein [Hahella aquimaris]|uniref:siphovirus Gp157 family protein n=1 Tax=Hahella sp. HNIBRBA332 TaxID=3015983 RepID=UPI00273B153E|nr:siphovirus Gp157 family protein [Hahella sp. HNIBRBA332]WLQ15386.1 siphovirus Gp157 family protein [Hahella sp. HNIBRBA332]WLQ15608.1 siphovirus Gp157 family protein [Hahella sp. HNIBRBA332]
MPKLYEITGKLAELHNIDADNDETLQQAIADTLEAVEGEFKDKAAQIARLLQNLEADRSAIKSEVDRLNRREKSIERKEESISEYLRNHMELTRIKTVSTPLHTISCVAGREVAHIEDEAALPQDYVAVDVTIKPNKQAITQDLKAGKDIPGARLELGKSYIRIK